jgi:hypothetical protein
LNGFYQALFHLTCREIVRAVRHINRSKILAGATEWYMIARHWRGWTDLNNANAYEALLKDKVLPSLKRVEGYRGGYIFRTDGPEETRCGEPV